MDVKSVVHVGHATESRPLDRFLLIQSLLTGNISPLKTAQQLSPVTS